MSNQKRKAASRYLPLKRVMGISVFCLLLSCVVARSAENTTSPAIGGELLDLSAKASLSGFAQNESLASLENGRLKVVFKSGAAYPNIKFPVPQGGWNLSAFGGLQLTVSNPGSRKVTVYLRMDNPGEEKDSHWNTQSIILEAGETKTLQGIFGQNNGAPGFPLDPTKVSGIQVFLIRPMQDTTLILSDLKAYGSPGDRVDKHSFSKLEDRSKPVTPPPWSGKRPPVEGDWVQTLDENFEGKQLNNKLWTTRYPWNGPAAGRLERYAPENVIVDGGVAKFKAEKRQGHENNDPKLGTREYSSGLIQSYDKWAQAYGYFEARIKLPMARGLWPAFWMMPDRGAAHGEAGRRSTRNGAMEIDIMEILSEWGPGRNNVAVHWDDYGPDHKAWGTSNIYYGPTPDGWHTFGLLWEPGKLIWYIDGIKKVEWENERVATVPGYLKLNVQIGGWATKDVEDAKLPDYMEVDYVRAWQLKDRMPSK